MRDSPWFLVRTQTSRESWAAENCSRQGCEVYFPRTLELVRGRAGKKEARLRPLFPNYLFVATGGSWTFLLGTFGVAALVMRGTNPDVVPLRIVEELRSREKDGVVVLPPGKFTPGQEVRVKSGSFKDHVGLVHGTPAASRIAVLLSLLGRKVVTLFPEQLLEAA